MTTLSKFIVEVVCSETECIVDDIVISTDKPAVLFEIVCAPGSQLQPGTRHDLEAGHLERLEKAFSIKIPRENYAFRLRPWHRLDNLPYRVHTNRELAMMLAGAKPLAAFSEAYPSNCDFEVIPERLFSPYVLQGRFLKREYVTHVHEPFKTRVVLYAKPSEAWRIDAYILLMAIAETSGWNRGFERMEGTLLGYEQWQNDAYLKTLAAGV